MKAFFFYIYAGFALIIFHTATAQKVGIGTNSPQAGVDVAGLGGGQTTMNIRGSLLSSSFHRSALENTRISGGKIGSRVILNDQGSGRVGIGTATPGFPLSFSDAFGDKISLWGNSGMHYGFGIQSYQLQIHTDMAGSDIVFGYGSSSLFTENMRIKGTGLVGIGVSDPVFKLDVADRIRIRSGGGFSTAGFYLNNNNNTASPAFIGMDDDAHVGFWGSGVGFKFAMNTQTGALRVNGNEGGAGQAITSMGGSQPQWSTLPKPSFNLSTMVTQTSSITMAELGPKTLLPGLQYTFTIPSNTKIVANVDLDLYSIPCSSCSYSWVSVDVELDGGLVVRTYGDIENGRQINFSLSGLFNAAPGTHTVRVTANTLYHDVEFRAGQSFSGRMILFMLPQ